MLPSPKFFILEIWTIKTHDDTECVSAEENYWRYAFIYWLDKKQKNLFRDLLESVNVFAMNLIFVISNIAVYNARSN